MQKLSSLLICLFFVVKGFAQSEDVKLRISHLTGNFYVFTTYNLYKGNRIPANGLYVVTNTGVIMIDTPWDTTQFQPLLDSIKRKHDQNVVMSIATHFHEDRTGGLGYYKQHGINTYTTKRTDSLSQKRNMERAEFLLHHDTTFRIGQYTFQTYFPGHGHTPDNIVIWFENEKILYGGCLIKSVVDNTLGNLADASIKDYATTVKNVQKKFKNPRFVIPGHNDWIDPKSVQHTFKMAIELRKQE